LSKKLKRNLILGAIAISLISFFTYKMFQLGAIECSICIKFKDAELCTKALGPSEEQAIEEAHRNACAMLASGVTEVVACNRAERTDSICIEP
jgi:hypothetical protein